MRPSFNSFQPRGHPQRPQQQNNGYSNQHQQNGYQNQVNPNQFGMMNPQMMNNPMMGHMNNPIPMPNMPIHPHFFNNNMPQQQLHQFGLPNINHLLPTLLGNLQFAVANNNLMPHSLPLPQPNFFRPPLEPSAFTSQPQLNSFNPQSYPPAPNPHQNHQLQRPPGFAAPPPQGQSGGIVNNNNGSNSNGNDFRNKFTKHQKFKGPGQGFQRSQSHQYNNAKKKFGFNKDRMGKGSYNKMASGPDGNIDKEKKRIRSYALLYTKKEIKQWRESRRKNYPTKLNGKKNAKNYISECTLDEERRQQLHEVLAKQAELGVEVAEVPSYYLSNTEKGKFQNNRHNKRRHGDRHKFSKKPRFEDENLSQESSVITREPTLLEKLLSADIKREKSQLLQVFRFMKMNSFFKEFPEQPLKLPLVMVEETGCEHDREDPTNEVLSDDGDSDVDSNGDDNSGDEAVER